MDRRDISDVLTKQNMTRRYYWQWIQYNNSKQGCVVKVKYANNICGTYSYSGSWQGHIPVLVMVLSWSDHNVIILFQHHYILDWTSKVTGQSSAQGNWRPVEQCLFSISLPIDRLPCPKIFLILYSKTFYQIWMFIFNLTSYWPPT